jgi:hypothetical protein
MIPSCGHTIEFSALDKYFKENSDKLNISCPVCQKKIHPRNIKEFPFNWTVIQITDSVNKILSFLSDDIIEDETIKNSTSTSIKNISLSEISKITNALIKKYIEPVAKKGLTEVSIPKKKYKKNIWESIIIELKRKRFIITEYTNSGIFCDTEYYRVNWY